MKVLTVNKGRTTNCWERNEVGLADDAGHQTTGDGLGDLNHKGYEGHKGRTTNCWERNEVGLADDAGHQTTGDGLGDLNHKGYEVAPRSSGEEEMLMI